MDLKRDVKPISYLKSRTADLVREVADEGRTVLITQNGKAKVVVMDVGLYDRWQSALALLQIIAHGEADFNAGRVCSTEQAFDEFEAAIRRVEG